MSELALLLQILQASNMASPAIVSIIATIRAGRAAGKTDAEIEAESMQIALDTRTQTEIDMGSEP